MYYIKEILIFYRLVIELSLLLNIYVIQKIFKFIPRDNCYFFFFIYDRFATKRALIILKNIASNIYFSSGPLMHSKNTFYIGNMLYLLLKIFTLQTNESVTFGKINNLESCRSFITHS